MKSESNSAEHVLPQSVKKTAIFAATGAIATLAGSQAHAAIIYYPLNLSLDAVGSATSTQTLSLPYVGLSAADGKATFTFTATTTNGVVLSKPSSSAPGAPIMTGVPADTTPTFFNAGDTIAPATPANYTSLGTSTTPGTTVGTSALTLISADGSTKGDFTEAAGQGYIGFYYNGTAAYRAGWIGFQTLTTTADGAGNEVKAVITGMAVESVAATPIAAGAVPEPSSLALLAAGSIGLMRFRRRSAR